jgi:hypothetical protein
MESFMLPLPSVSVKSKFGGVARSVELGEEVTVANAQKMIHYMDEIPAANGDAPDLTLADINTLFMSFVRKNRVT